MLDLTPIAPDWLGAGLLALAAVGAGMGVRLSVGATYGRAVVERIAWAIVAAIIGASVALGMPGACMDITRSDDDRPSSGRYGVP